VCCALWFPYYRALDLEEQHAWALQGRVKTPEKTLSMFLLKEESKGRNLSSMRELKNEFLRLSGNELLLF